MKFTESILKHREWACSGTIIIMSIFLQTDIVVITNEINDIDVINVPRIFQTSTAFQDRLNIVNILILPNNKEIYIYQHICGKPLQPAPLIDLNHFCALRRRPRKPNDFTFPSDNNIRAMAYIVNNGISDLELKIKLKEMTTSNKKK